MASHTPPNRSRSFITPLFYHMPFLLDQVHNNEGYGDASYQRTGSPILIMSAGQFEREQGNKLVDIDAILEACKKEVYVPSHSSHGLNRGSQHVECPICLEKFETNDKMLRLPCNHPFHVDCILPWIRSNNDKCPFCRANITTKKSPSSSFGTLNNVTRSRTSPNYSTRDMHANYGHMPLHISTSNERNLLRGVNGPNQTYAPPPDLASSAPSTPRVLSSTIRNPHHAPMPINYGANVREIPISSPQGSSQETSIPNQRPPTGGILNAGNPFPNQRTVTPPTIDIPISYRRPSQDPQSLSRDYGSIRRHSNPTYWQSK
ncbi:hypothetical protein L7F22_036946 [Adiantum nelumboides]|nr:hypothetical protein [Adiantum nelumboides]